MEAGLAAPRALDALNAYRIVSAELYWLLQQVADAFPEPKIGAGEVRMDVLLSLWSKVASWFRASTPVWRAIDLLSERLDAGLPHVQRWSNLVVLVKSNATN